MKSTCRGFTLIEIMIVVAIIGVLAVIAIPSFMKARTTSQANACINNLRQIESAKEQWALERRKGSGIEVITSEVMAFIKNPSAVTNCPSGGGMIFGYVGTNATCDIEDHLLSN